MIGRSRNLAWVGLPILVVCSVLVSGQDDRIPSHPSQLKFSRLDFTPPDPTQSRHVLANGVVCYLVEDHDLPLVDIRVLIRSGDYLEPDGKTGLAQLTGQLLRSGGTQRLSAEEFDEEADFLAANIGSSLGAWSGSASVNALSKDLDVALGLFFEMLRTPGFQQDRLDLAKSQLLQQMERRNDQTNSIEQREWARLLRGDSHFSTEPLTKASVESIDVEAIREFHGKYYHPGNFIFAVSGDFDTEQLKRKLEDGMAGWKSLAQAPPVPRPDHRPRGGVYLVNKSDVNQGRVSLGHLGIELGNPDEYSIDLMNDILGGSGFTSRILKRVRSDEGLAYSAGSSFALGAHYPGQFRAFFQSKSATCAEAAQIILDEIVRIRSEPVTEEELETVKTSAVETFPRRFSSAAAVAGTFANAELVGRDLNYYATYRDRIREVTAEEVLRVAKKYLDPDNLVILAVGNVEDMLRGNPDKPEYSFEQMGKITRIPLPDPLTMQYPQQ
jgi:predicted Zn-dependent peptidase